jgi:hypothetical protein
MDTTPAGFTTTTSVAAELGTNLPRLHRAIRDEAGVERIGGRYWLSPVLVDQLRRQLGAIPKLDGLSRPEVQVLTALSRHPRGLVSVRQVAGAAKVSPTCASRALSGLENKRLAVTTEPVVFDGTAERRKVWELNWGSPEWLRVAPAVGKAVLPAGQTPVRRPSRLPARLASTFWTGDWRKLNVDKDPAYVAQRILEEGRGDPEAIAFLAQLPASALIEARRRTPLPRGEQA